MKEPGRSNKNNCCLVMTYLKQDLGKQEDGGKGIVEVSGPWDKKGVTLGTQSKGAPRAKVGKLVVLWCCEEIPECHAPEMK